MARRQRVRNSGASASSGRSRSKKMNGPVGWLYLLAGIVLVFAAYFVDPALISALIFFVIGIGLLVAGFGMMGFRMGFPCPWLCDENCATH